MSKLTINQNKPIICFVEGTIGAGKSTFIKQLQKYHLNAQFFQEPVAEWQNTKDGNGKNVLSYFYEDMSKYCYMFQSYAFITRISQLDDLDLESKDIIFIERSIFSDRNVFAKPALKQDYLMKLNGSHIILGFTTCYQNISIYLIMHILYIYKYRQKPPWNVLINVPDLKKIKFPSII